MDDDGLNPVINRIDGLESRLKAVEDQKRDESRGWVAKITHLGIVVGCVGGILGGANTLWDVWKEVLAKPDVRVQLGGPLNVDWDPNGRRLSFNYGFVLQNNGRAPGAVTALRAYMEHVMEHVDVSVTQGPFQLKFPSIDLSEMGKSVRLPTNIQVNYGRDIDLTIASELTHEQEQAFYGTGLKKLIVEFEASQTGQAIYCFWLGQDAANALAITGVLDYSGPDSGCKLSDE
jgi:hypothetical protein